MSVTQEEKNQIIKAYLTSIAVKGGRVKSDRKAAACRLNGSKPKLKPRNSVPKPIKKCKTAKITLPTWDGFITGWKPREGSGTQTALYCLVAPDGEVIYVGTSRDPYGRQFKHKDRITIPWQMLVLCFVDPVHADKIESQVIRAFWRKSQCKFNKTTPDKRFSSFSVDEAKRV